MYEAVRAALIPVDVFQLQRGRLAHAQAELREHPDYGVVAASVRRCSGAMSQNTSNMIVFQGLWD
jgi:hypothetical protein